MQPTQEKINQTGRYNYLLFRPRGYEELEQQWPLILFLHGSGERGDNLERVKIQGIPKMLEQEKHQNFPFIVVSPQCPEGETWSAELLSAFLDRVMDAYFVDRSRVYLTGLSMGGHGTWNLAAAQPQRFAAAVPIAGRKNPVTANTLKDLPIWAFHGARDRRVPIKESEAMVEAIKACNGKVKFTVYPEADHVESWEQAYSNPSLYDWLLQHRRSQFAYLNLSVWGSIPGLVEKVINSV